MKYLKLPFLALALAFQFGCLWIAIALSAFAKKMRRRQAVKAAKVRMEKARQSVDLPQRADESKPCPTIAKSVSMSDDDFEAAIQRFAQKDAQRMGFADMSEVEFEYEEKN